MRHRTPTRHRGAAQRRRETEHRKPAQGADGRAWLSVGRNAAVISLKHRSELCSEVLLSQGAERFGGELSSLLAQSSVPQREVSRHDLSALAGTEHHQGIAVRREPPKVGTLHDLLELFEGNEPRVVVAVDSVQDPQNLGSIMRAAECFGCDGVVWSKNRSPGLTPVVVKASVGAVDLVPLFEVANLADALDKAAGLGACVVTAEIAEDALPVAEFKAPDQLILVLGSEGEGVQPLISKRADQRLYVPMAGAIDSLNVSQAAAVFLASLTQNLGNSRK